MARHPCLCALFAAVLCVWLLGGCDSGPDPPAAGALERKLLLLAVDGADWDLIDPLVERGELPHFERLMREGSRARLQSIEPIISPVVWSTIATGKGPLEHGVLDFLTRDNDGRPMPVTRRQLKARPLWSMLGDAGIPVSVTGWWASWPAEKVNGYLVSDRLVYHMFGMPEADASAGADGGAKTWPRELLTELEPLLVRPEAIQQQRLAAFINRQALGEADAEERFRLNELRIFLAGSASYEAVGLELLRRQPRGFHSFYYALPDRLGHVFMQFRPPRRSGVAERRVNGFGQAVDAAYRETDAMLGRVLDRLGPDWNLLLVSDHGFRHGADRPRRDQQAGMELAAAGWHDPYGVFLLWGPDVGEGLELGTVSVMDVVPTVLALYGLPVAEDMPGRVIQQALKAGFLGRHPITNIPSYGQANPVPAAPPPSKADAFMMERLKALGYLHGEPELPPDAVGVSAAGVDEELNRGIAYLTSGRPDQAVAAFERAEAAGGGVRALVMVAEARMALGELDAAGAAVAELERLDPSQPVLLPLRGRLAFRRGDLDAAALWLRRAIDAQPGDAAAHLLLGQTLLKQEHFEPALLTYANTLSLFSDRVEAALGAGTAALRLGKLKDAESYLLRATELDPGELRAFELLGEVYLAGGQPQRAIRVWQISLEQQPEQPEQPELRARLEALLEATPEAP